MPETHPSVVAETDRIAARSAATRAAYLDRIAQVARRGSPARERLGCANQAHGFAACDPARSGSCSAGRRGRNWRSSPPTTTCSRRTSRSRPTRPHQRRAVVAAGGVAQVAGGVPGDVRRHHAGPCRHGAVAVQPRCDRAVDRGRARARHVRRCAAARRVRQDRARPADRRARVRPPAGAARAGRPDAVRAAERREEAACDSCTRRARRAARSCSTPSRPPTTRPAPAPSTAPRTRTSCWSRRWGCSCRAPAS